jgi:hypothetical protein
MRIMNQKEFDAIYPKKLKPLQHEVLDMWLQGKSEEAIAKSLHRVSDTIFPISASYLVLKMNLAKASHRAIN